VRSKRVDGGVRFKAIELSASGEKIWLYRSQIYPMTGFTHPPELGAELTKRFGPFQHEEAWSSYHSHKISDAATCEEELIYHAQWVGHAARYLWNKLNIHLYYQHMHLLDSLNHTYLSSVDPTGIAYGRIPEEEGWAAFRMGYRMVDRMVGEVSKAADKNTIVAVCSDHGDVPNRRAVALYRLFEKRGWVSVRTNAAGHPEIDLARSKLRYNQNHLWINLKGREPFGSVDPKHYESLRQDVLDAMLDLKDPKDGRRPIALALKREDAAILGMYGKAVGDIVFYHSRGYRWGGTEVFGLKHKQVVFDDPGGANHGPQNPMARTDTSDNAAAIVLAGPGVRKGYIRDPQQVPPMFTPDMAPTLAHLAGIEPPAHTEGKVVRDLLAGAKGKMKRSHRKIDMPTWRRRSPVRKKKVRLAGDVTDER